MNRYRLTFATILGLVAATQVQAQTSTAAASAPAKSSLKESTKITYIGTYNGASVANPFDGVKTFQANKDNEEITEVAGFRNPNDPVSLTNRFDLRFKVTDTVKVGPTLLFDYYGRSDARLVLLNPFLSISKSDLGAVGDVKFSGEFRAALPLSEASQKGSMVTTLNPRLTTSYSIPETSVNLEALTAISYRIYRRTGTQATFVGRQWIQGGYTFSDKFDAYLGFDWQLPIAAGSTGPTDTFMEIGANWTPISNLTLNPYVDLETDFRIASDTSLWGMNLIWGIL